MRNFLIGLIVISLFVCISFSNSYSQASQQNENILIAQANSMRMTFDQLPDKVKATISQHCKEHNIKSIAKEELKGITVYKIECKERREGTVYVINEDGEIVSSEAIKK